MMDPADQAAVLLERAELAAAQAAEMLEQMLSAGEWIRGLADPSPGDVERMTACAATLANIGRTRRASVVEQLHTSAAAVDAAIAPGRAAVLRAEAAMLDAIAADVRLVAATDEMLALIHQRVECV
jgi:hypothetical protein